MEKEIKKTSNTSLEGLPHGQGTYTWSDGEGKIEGEFKEGKVWNVKVYNKSGKVINTWKNGVKD